MDLSGNISNLVFKKKVKSDIGEVSLDSHMLKFLMALDGKRKVHDIIRVLNIDISTIKEILIKLDNLNLIELDLNSVECIDKSFYDYLLEELALAIGPMAEIIIDEEIKALDFDRNSFPVFRAPELIENISDSIPRNDKKIKFQQNMLVKLKNL